MAQKFNLKCNNTEWQFYGRVVKQKISSIKLHLLFEHSITFNNRLWLEPGLLALDIDMKAISKWETGNYGNSSEHDNNPLQNRSFFVLTE